MVKQIQKNKHTKNDGISEYLRIRRYVMNLLYRSAEKDSGSLRIPSLQELSAKFQVSRPTVCKALKELIEEGYLLAKPGLGTFINPNWNGKDMQFQPKLPLIGIIFGDGMNVHLDIYFGDMLSELLKQIIRIPAMIHQIPLTTTTPEHVYELILQEQLDGLCWCHPDEKYMSVIRQLREYGLPVVVGGARDPEKENMGDVFFDSEGLGYLCGKEMIRQNRTNIMFIGKNSAHERPLLGIRRAFLEEKIPFNEKLCLGLNDQTLYDIRKIFELGVPVDAIFNPYMKYVLLAEILKEYHVDLEQQCLLFQNEYNLYGESFFSGILYRLPMGKYAEVLTERLRKYLSGEPRLNHYEKIEIPVEFHRRNFSNISEHFETAEVLS